MTISRPFTLLEIMVCLLLLSIIGGAIAWNIPSLIARSKQNHAKERLRNHLEELKMLALTHRADITLEVTVNGTKAYYQDITDEPIPNLHRKKSLLSDHSKGITPRTYHIHSTGRIE